MSPPTYKVFNLYFSIRCGTYNSHLHTTLPFKCDSINSSCFPFKQKLLLSCLKAMCSLTYKVFNLYFSIRCGTYNSHLHTTLPLKCESINLSCFAFKRKLLLSCIVVASFSAIDRHACTTVAALCANGPATVASFSATDRHTCTVVAALCANGPTTSVIPFVEPGP